MTTHQHLLQELKLPSRYESLVAAIGPEIARLLVAPSEDVLDLFRESALHIKAKGRGLFLPLHAPSGTGKTTLITSVGSWIPKEFGPTARLAGGEVSAERLRQAVEALTDEFGLPANEARVLVINVDDRESDPPSDKELSQIKSFVREPGVGSRTLVVWPETSSEHAKAMASAYEERAGKSPVSIPAKVSGPPTDAWQGIAIETLKLVNGLSNLEELGVDPRVYDPEADATLGDFLDRIASDFVALLSKLLAETRKPIQVLVALASESGRAGVLSDLTGSARYGLLDADRLLGSTPNSVIGRWWSQRRGLLVQTIVRLDARVVHLAPSLTIPIIRRFGPEPASEALEKLGVSSRPPSDISNYFERADFGRLLLGTDSATAEIRGNPAADAQAAFALLASEYGFGSGNDKKLNVAIGDYLTQGKPDLGHVVVERKLPYLPLIPDLALDADDAVTAIEIHWRSGDFLTTTNRSEIAQYVLRKLKAYAVESNWASD